LTRKLRNVCLAASLAAAAALSLVALGSAAASPQSDRTQLRSAAVKGIAAARSHWWDSRHNWYDSHLNDQHQYPLATIWDIVPLFEATSARAIDSPTAKTKAAVSFFAKHAEKYWDPALKPHGGYAPYPGDRGGQERTWFDDNGWWGIAFVDAYRATGNKGYLTDAARALDFIATRGWASKGGGLWWDTTHSHKAGEALASGSVLAAMLYEQTGKTSYLKTARRFLNWGDAHFIGQNGLYSRTDTDRTPMGYVEGPMIGAHEILCRKANDAHACDRAHTLAEASLQRFGDYVNQGPQFDTIYLRWMLELYQRDGDSRWYDLAHRNGMRALGSARDSRGLYMRAWDGGPIIAHQAVPGMIQTHSATVALFAWLGAAPVPHR
jgi:hypothetical protein